MTSIRYNEREKEKAQRDPPFAKFDYNENKKLLVPKLRMDAPIGAPVLLDDYDYEKCKMKKD